MSMDRNTSPHLPPPSKCTNYVKLDYFKLKETEVSLMIVSHISSCKTMKAQE